MSLWAVAQSDIYSLGLILYEAFTGEMAHKFTSPDAPSTAQAYSSPKPPSSVVDDVDPVVERVVMACLHSEPHERPQSSQAVLAAFPGGDALEAALSAGEAPSPELVAGAGEGQRLAPKAAATCFAAVVIGMACIALLSIRSQRLIGFSADELMRDSQARDLVRDFGYDLSAADSTWGVAWNKQYFESFQDN